MKNKTKKPFTKSFTMSQMKADDGWQSQAFPWQQPVGVQPLSEQNWQEQAFPWMQPTGTSGPQVANAQPQESPSYQFPQMKLNQGQGALGTGDLLTGGIELANAFAPQHQQKRSRKPNLVYNQNPQGTGSSELMRYGGEVYGKGLMPKIRKDTWTPGDPIAHFEDGGSMQGYTPSGRKSKIKVGYDQDVMPIETQSKRLVTYEPLRDAQGQISQYSPVFHGSWAHHEVLNELRNQPKEFSGIPVVSSPDSYSEMYQGFRQGTSGPYSPTGPSGEQPASTEGYTASNYRENQPVYSPAVWQDMMSRETPGAFKMGGSMHGSTYHSSGAAFGYGGISKHDNYGGSHYQMGGKFGSVSDNPDIYYNGGDIANNMTGLVENPGNMIPQGKSGIHIKPENKGKFTAYKKRTGKTTSEALHSKDPHVRKMANFARNAKKWHHGEDGIKMDGNATGYLPYNTNMIGGLDDQNIYNMPYKQSGYRAESGMSMTGNATGYLPYTPNAIGGLNDQNIYQMPYKAYSGTTMPYQAPSYQEGKEYDLSPAQIKKLESQGYKLKY